MVNVAKVGSCKIPSNDRDVSKACLIMVTVFLLTTLLMNWKINEVDALNEPLYTLNISTETIVDALPSCGVSFVFVPDGRIFCAVLKTGEVRIIENFELLPDPLIKLDIYHKIVEEKRDERGLIGMTIDPEFETNHFVYLHWTYLDPDVQEPYRRIARFTESSNKLTNMTIIFDKIPSGFNHNGGPLEFGADGKLYITGGEATQRKKAQDLNSPLGKILRINADGSIPDDNPFPGLPYYTLGHRNVFGIGFHPITNIPYITENGPTEDDELNILIPGKNYGWPDVTGKSGDERFVDPLLEFTPTIAPTELLFYTGNRYPAEVNNMFFIAWNERALYRLVLKPPNYDEVLSVDTFDIPVKMGTLIDVEEGPDGYLYVSSFRWGAGETSIVRLVFDYSNITTAISLDVRADKETNENAKLTAKISDYFGSPVPDALIRFFDSDKLVGSAVSDQEGIARLAYNPQVAEDHRFRAEFEGGEKYRTGESPQRLWSIDGTVSMPILESVANENVKVRLSWSPSEPVPDIPTKFTVEFVNPETNILLDNIEYDFTLMKGNTILLSKTNQTATNGSALQQFTFDTESAGTIQIVIENINNMETSAMFTINIIPEFPFYVSMLIMTTLVAISITLMNYRRLAK